MDGADDLQLAFDTSDLAADLALAYFESGVSATLKADGSPVTETIYTHVISEDGKRIAAQLGNAVWGILDASWTEKENGSGVEAPKPLYLN